jgi:hypothetical protein
MADSTIPAIVSSRPLPDFESSASCTSGRFTIPAIVSYRPLADTDCSATCRAEATDGDGRAACAASLRHALKAVRKRGMIMPDQGDEDLRELQDD